MSCGSEMEADPTGLALARRSFLRAHVRAELGRHEEVLAVRAVVERLEREGRPIGAEARRALLDRYFAADEPDDRLYLPLALRPIGPGRGWASLTDALRAPDRGGEPAGIVLSARTGAGKTLSTIAAFRDALLPVADRHGLDVAPPP
ncbi:MAG: hypothetical protein K2X91_15535, partial [Thermoleophilia bacterium]|nr:hypothetical protein [Thermoleophilia bacterium]